MATCRETWAGKWPVKKGEVIRLYLDFARHGALAAGDSLTGTPTFTIITAGSGITNFSPVISGTVVSAMFDTQTGVVQDWEVKVLCGTALGQTLIRSATLSLEA